MLTLKYNLMDRPALGTPDCDQAEASVANCVNDAKAHVEALLKPGEAFERHFSGVKCGATQWYRDLNDEADAEAHLTWLQNNVLAGLPPKTKYDFDCLTGTEEASLEWISVKHAMAIEFADSAPHAALAGGKGSVQTSMDGAGGHGAHHLSARVALKEGTTLVSEKGAEGVASWRESVAASVDGPFAALRETLSAQFPPGARKADEPVRFICSARRPSGALSARGGGATRLLSGDPRGPRSAHPRRRAFSTWPSRQMWSAGTTRRRTRTTKPRCGRGSRLSWTTKIRRPWTGRTAFDFSSVWITCSPTTRRRSNSCLRENGMLRRSSTA